MLHNQASDLLLSSRAYADRFFRSRVDVLLYAGWAIVIAVLGPGITLSDWLSLVGLQDN